MLSRARFRCAAVVALLAQAIACSTTLRSGLPPGAPAAKYDERWRHAFFLGLVESDSTPDLARICPGGWSEITMYASFLNVLTQLVTAYVFYTPRSLTIICAAPGAPSAAPPSAWGPAPLPSSSAYPPASTANAYPPPLPPPVAH